MTESIWVLTTDWDDYGGHDVTLFRNRDDAIIHLKEKIEDFLKTTGLYNKDGSIDERISVEWQNDSYVEINYDTTGEGNYTSTLFWGDVTQHPIN